MNKAIAIGTIKNGELKVFNKSTFLSQIKNMPDCMCSLTVAKKFKKRSDPQNAYYWGVVITCFINGYKETQGKQIDSNSAHEFLKQECNYDEIINVETGEIKKIGLTTTELSTSDFSAYVEECKQFIFEWFNIAVPEPNEQTELKFL